MCRHIYKNVNIFGPGPWGTYIKHGGCVKQQISSYVLQYRASFYVLQSRLVRGDNTKMCEHVRVGEGWWGESSGWVMCSVCGRKGWIGRRQLWCGLRGVTELQIELKQRNRCFTVWHYSITKHEHTLFVKPEPTVRSARNMYSWETEWRIQFNISQMGSDLWYLFTTTRGPLNMQIQGQKKEYCG